MRLFLLIWWMGLFLPASFADKLVLEDGTEIRGEIAFRSHTHIWLRLADGELRKFEKQAIKQVVDEEEEKPKGTADEPAPVDLSHFESAAFSACTDCSGRGYRPCARCGGQWEDNRLTGACDECDGSGKRKCRNCHGSGRSKCQRCYGQGKLKRTRYVRSGGLQRPETYYEDCKHCSSGKRKCRACSGGANSPRRTRVGGAPIIVGYGRGRGVVSCQRCDGAGEVERFGECPECEQGHVACRKCRMFRSLRNTRPPDVPDYFDAMNQFAGQIGVLLLRLGKEDGGAHSGELVASEGVIPRVDMWLTANSETLTEFWSFLNQNRSRFAKFFDSLRGVARHPLTWYSDDVPIHLARKGDQRVLVLGGATSTFTLNEARSSPRTRAKRALRLHVEPIIPAVSRSFEPTGIEHVAVVLSYGARNFVTEKSAGVGVEVVAICTPMTACNEFAKGRITFEMLVKRSEVFFKSQHVGARGTLARFEL